MGVKDMEKRSINQNNSLWDLLTKHEIQNDSEARAKLAKHFSHGRTTHTSELYANECEALIKYLQDAWNKKEEELRRLRWRLWFAFAESKYEHFRVKDSKHPNYNIINDYCEKHWGVKIGDMTKSKLQEKIAIVQKWK